MDGLCRFAQERFGMLAFTVLSRWGLAAASDVGEIVFQLVEAGILSRRDEDSRADFDLDIDLKQTLEDSYFDRGTAPAA
jgi:uncharacterized repeat protein (TIGR04138 family)